MASSRTLAARKRRRQRHRSSWPLIVFLAVSACLIGGGTYYMSLHASPPPAEPVPEATATEFPPEAVAPAPRLRPPPVRMAARPPSPTPRPAATPTPTPAPATEKVPEHRVVVVLPAGSASPEIAAETTAPPPVATASPHASPARAAASPSPVEASRSPGASAAVSENAVQIEMVTCTPTPLFDSRGHAYACDLYGETSVRNISGQTVKQVGVSIRSEVYPKIGDHTEVPSLSPGETFTHRWHFAMQTIEVGAILAEVRVNGQQSAISRKVVDLPRTTASGVPGY